MRLRLVAVGLAVGLAAALAAPAPARAAEPDAASQAAITVTAVELADEAGELFQAGKFAEALDRYQRADALVRRHTLGLRVARCLARLGRLSEAADRYDAVIRAELPAGLDPDKLERQKEARAQAEVERDALLPRIPGVVVKVTGAKDAVVTLDGRRLPAALIGVKVAADPGAHHLEVRAGAEVVTCDVNLEEGRVVPVSFELHEPAPAPSPPGPLVAPPKPAPAGSARARSTAGLVIIGAGGMVLVTGLVAGAVALAEYASLRNPSKCGSDFGNCAPSAQNAVSAYNGGRLISSVGIIAGTLMTVPGIVLVATARGPRDGKTSAISIGPGWASVRGAF